MTVGTTSSAEHFEEDDLAAGYGGKTFATGSLSSEDNERAARFATRPLPSSLPRTDVSKKVTGASQQPYGVDVELSRLRGVVVRVTNEVVEVSFSEPTMEVAFPAPLLEGTGLARYGQSIDYIVRQRPDGYRYQTFVAAAPANENPYTAQLEQLLAVIDDG